jgi:hypothetical protein
MIVVFTSTEFNEEVAQAKTPFSGNPSLETWQTKKHQN